MSDMYLKQQVNNTCLDKIKRGYLFQTANTIEFRDKKDHTKREIKEHSLWKGLQEAAFPVSGVCGKLWLLSPWEIPEIKTVWYSTPALDRIPLQEHPVTT